MGFSGGSGAFIDSSSSSEPYEMFHTQVMRRDEFKIKRRKNFIVLLERDDIIISGSPRPYPAAVCPGPVEPCGLRPWCLARPPRPRFPPPSPLLRSLRTSRNAPGSGFELPVPPEWWEEGSCLGIMGHR